MKPRHRRTSEAINWQKVRERLARAARSAEESGRLSPERARALLEERARDLARVHAEAGDDAEGIQILVFTLANERYAIATDFVREVVPLGDITPLPGAPSFVTGVINLRGHILAVFDLRQFFGIAVRGLTDLTRVLVLGGERAEFGVLADAAVEVRSLRRAEVQEPPGSVAGVAREYLRGVTSDALVVLDGAVLLQDQRLYIDQGEEAGGAAVRTTPAASARHPREDS